MSVIAMLAATCVAGFLTLLGKTPTLNMPRKVFFRANPPSVIHNSL